MTAPVVLKHGQLGFAYEEQLREAFRADLQTGRVVGAWCHRCGFQPSVHAETYSCERCGSAVAALMADEGESEASDECCALGCRNCMGSGF